MNISINISEIENLTPCELAKKINDNMEKLALQKDSVSVEIEAEEQIYKAMSGLTINQALKSNGQN